MCYKWKLCTILLLLFAITVMSSLTIIPPAPGNNLTRALGISNLKISTTISTSGVYYCGWRYGGEFDVNSFYSFVGCSNYTGVNETITCVNNPGNVTSQLTLLQPQYKDLNIKMQCSPSPSYSVNFRIKNCAAPKDVNVISNKSDYNSDGSVNCPSGSELFYKVNGSFVVDRTTTCNAYAEWTNINNMLCSKGPETLSITGNYTVGVIRGNKIALHCNYSGETPPAKFSRFYFNQKTRNVSRSSTWISHPLKASDNNKVVECQAVNQYTNYFNQSHRANITLNVTYPPETSNAKVICDWVINNTGVCNISFASNPPVDWVELQDMKETIIDDTTNNCQCNTETQMYSFRVNKVTDSDFGKYSLKLKSSKFPEATLNVTIVIRDKNSNNEETKFPIIIVVAAGGGSLIIILVSIGVVLYIKKRRSIKALDKKDVVNSSPGSRDIHTETGGVGENQSFANPALENGAENSGLVTKSKKKQEYAVAQKGKKKKKTKDEKEIKDNPLYVAGSPDQVEDAYAEVNKKGKNIKEEKVNPLYATTQASGQTSGDYATVDLKKKKGKGITKKEDKINPLYVSSDQPDKVEDAYAEVDKKKNKKKIGKGEKEEKVNPLYGSSGQAGKVEEAYAEVDKKKNKKKIEKGEKEEKVNPLYVSSYQPDKVEDAYAEVDKKKNKKTKAKTGKAGKKGNSQQASSSGGHEEVDLNKKIKKEKPTKEEKVNPLYVSSDQPDKVEDAYAEVDKKKNKKKSATNPDKEEKVNPLYVSSDQPDKVEDAYAEVDKSKNKKKLIKATPTKDQPSTSKNETYTEVKKLKKKPLNQNNNENTQQTQDDATYYSVVLHGSHKKDKDKLDESEDSEQE